jgi:hypothetical protein
MIDKPSADKLAARNDLPRPSNDVLAVSKQPPTMPQSRWQCIEAKLHDVIVAHICYRQSRVAGNEKAKSAPRA